MITDWFCDSDFRENLVVAMVEDMRRGHGIPKNPMAPGSYKVFRATGEGLGRPGVAKGYRVGRPFTASKMDPDKVRDMRARRETLGTTYARLGEEFGVSENFAMQICKRIKWRHVA